MKQPTMCLVDRNNLESITDIKDEELNRKYLLSIAKILLLTRNLRQRPVGDQDVCKVYYANDALVSQRRKTQS